MAEFTFTRNCSNNTCTQGRQPGQGDRVMEWDYESSGNRVQLNPTWRPSCFRRAELVCLRGVSSGWRAEMRPASGGCRSLVCRLPIGTQRRRQLAGGHRSRSLLLPSSQASLQERGGETIHLFATFLQPALVGPRSERAGQPAGLALAQLERRRRRSRWTRRGGRLSPAGLSWWAAGGQLLAGCATYQPPSIGWPKDWWRRPGRLVALATRLAS